MTLNPVKKITKAMSGRTKSPRTLGHKSSGLQGAIDVEGSGPQMGGLASRSKAHEVSEYCLFRVL